MKTDKYTLKAELHIHSDIKDRLFYCPILYDSVQKVEEILERVIQLGIKILAITDHGSFKGYFEAKKIISKQNLDILLVPACEISSKGGDILAYGIEKEIPQKLSPEETIKLIHQQGGIAVAAHPYNFVSLGDKIFRLKFDAIEGYNSFTPDKANKKAISAGKMIGLPCIAGSDAHIPSEVGKGLVIFPEGTSTIKEVLENIKRGKFSISSTKTNILKIAPGFVYQNFKSQLSSFFNT